MTTTESVATSTTTVSTVTTMINTENILSSSTTSETNTTTMIERKTNKNSYQTYGIFCGAALLFLGLLLLTYIYFKKKSRRKMRKTIPVLIQGSIVSKTLTTRDRKNSHVLYLEAPTDSIDPKSKNLSSLSLALNALDRAQNNSSSSREDDRERRKHRR